MEFIVAHTVSAAIMVIVGAVIAKGWPERTQKHGRTPLQSVTPEEDAFARDLAAMLGYTGEEEEDADET